MCKRIGIIGFGHLGKYLVSKILADDDFELAFVWNRTKSAFHSFNFSDDVLLDNLSDFIYKKPEIIVEVAHPAVTELHGKEFLQYCDYMIGSPTALSNQNLYEELKCSAVEHGLYIPSGAFWGGEDIRKMSDAGKLKSLKVTMKKHPLSLNLYGVLKERNAQVKDTAVVLYEGCVRGVCASAPNNTNTMAAAALAAPSLGFDGVQGCLIADPNLVNYHIVEVEAMGFPREDGSCFNVYTIRTNPAVLGAVTGDATYDAYFGSLKKVGGKGPGIHLC